jgi:hypothetical protein
MGAFQNELREKTERNACRKVDVDFVEMEIKAR